MKHRTLIEMLAFITVAILVIVLYFSGVTVFADSNFNFSRYHIGSITRNSVSDEYTIFINENDTTYDNIWSIYAPNFNFTCTDDDVTLEGADCYIMVGTGNSVVGYYMPADTFIIYDDNGYSRFFCNQSSYNSYMANNNNTMIQGNFYDNGTDFGYMSLPVTSNVDNESYCSTRYLRDFKCLSSNCAIYKVSDVDEFTSFNDVIGSNVNPNYNTDDSEIIRDHRNFNPAFMFISTNTNYGGDGLVTSLGYDKWQSNNLDRFKITWDYSLDFTIASTSESATKHFVKNGYSQSLDNIPSGRFAMSLPEIFTTMYDGNTNCWNTIKDISMKTIKNDSSFGFAGGVNIGVANFQLSTNTPLTLDRAIGITEFKFYVTASIVTDNGLDCGTFGYTYDFLDGTYTNNSTFKDQETVNNTISQYNHDNNLSSGDSGYLDITDYQSNLPASNNYPAVSGGSVSQGGNASAQGGVAYGSNVNNSVIVNTGQDAKEIIKYAKNELLPANYEGGYVEKLETVTDSNNFIQYMSTTFSFMPQTFWNDVAYYGKIALIILVSGFILSLVRRLIT